MVGHPENDRLIDAGCPGLLVFQWGTGFHSVEKSLEVGMVQGRQAAYIYTPTEEIMLRFYILSRL